MLSDSKIVSDRIKKYKNEGESSIRDTNSRSHYLTEEEKVLIIEELGHKYKLKMILEIARL